MKCINNLSQENLYNMYKQMKFTQLQFDQIHRGYVQGVDFAIYARHKYSWQQMHQIRLGLIGKVDVTKYLDDSISAERMKEIRLALQKSIRKV